MDIGRLWRALTAGERSILVASGLVLALLVLGGAVLLGATPFEAAQTTPAGGSVVDTDGDGLSDDNEALLFGTDPQQSDTDGDGIPDGWEAEHTRTDPSTGLLTPDPARNDTDADPDDDGLTNLGEFQANTDPWRADTDGDGLTDGWEVDSDHDPLDPVTPSLDSDGDGLTAQEEFEQGTLDNTFDTDGDGLTDIEEPRGTATIGGQSFSFTPTDPAAASTGGSGLIDGFAIVHDLDPHGPNVGRVDHDDDGLATGLEAQASLDRFPDTRTALLEGLDPNQADTDGDGLPDGWEVTHDLDPLDPADGNQDSDGDGLTNGREFFWRTDPLTSDTDGDGLTDGEEVEGFEIEVDGRSRQATSNPLLADSDNDGLGDLAERQGTVTINGTEVTFPPTHPLLPDTDGDGLQDATEVERTFGQDQRLNPTLADTDGDRLIDGEELAYWTDREESAQDGLPDALTPPSGGECRAEATGAIQAQRASVLGPAGDPDGDCIPNILDADSDRRADSSMPPGTKPVLDGQEVNPPERGGRQLPGSDPALVDTDGDALPDEWEIRWARFGADVDGSPAWLFDPSDPNSDADETEQGEPILDGTDDDEGQDLNTGTPECWQNIVYDDDPAKEATGDSVPGGASYTNVDEMRRDTDPIGRLACDSDEDGLVDGWEAAFQGPNIDPKRALESPWEGAILQTACYPGSAAKNPSLPPLSELAATTLSLNEVPPNGPVQTPLDEDLLPSENPRGQIAWALDRAGCAWTGDSASFGKTCEDCTVVGIVVTLELQQWFKTDPTETDTDGDGAPDAWEILWYALAGDRRDLVDPAGNDRDPDGDGASMLDEFSGGSSPLTADTDGDDEDDGPDDNPLAKGDKGAFPISDQDGDHLLDDPCRESDVLGTFQPDESTEVGQARAQASRDLRIVEPEAGVFLCEPRADPTGSDVDADDDGIADVLEMLASYPNPRLLDNGRTADGDEDGIPTLVEPNLGRPVDWPDTSVWWFGANPLSANGFDADGDGLAEGLRLDPTPFEDLPEAPTPANAWRLACETGIVCPGERTFTWSGSTSTSDLSVTLENVGEADAADRRITKDGTDLGATVEVTQGGSGVADMPVALLALDANAASQLANGDLSVLANPEQVICILRTGADGTATSSNCPVVSGPASADLTGVDRSWLGTDTPSWDRDLAVLDPTVSHERRSEPANQVKIVAWAMGLGSDIGTTDQQPVLVGTTANVTFANVPTRAPSGEEITVTANVVDGAGDPLQAGSLTLETGGTEYTVPVVGEPTVKIPGVELPNTTTALDQDLNLAYSHSPATYVGGDTANQTLRVLPLPEILVDPPATAVANETIEVGIQVEGPTGDPVEGPVEIQLKGANATGTTGADGRTTLSMRIPANVRPGTGSLVARFEGTDAYGPAQTEQNVPVNQKLRAELSPSTLRLTEDTPFTVRLVDLAGSAPLLDVNLSLSLGEETATGTLPATEDLTTITLPVTGDIGETTLSLTGHTAQDRRYAPINDEIPVLVRSPGQVEIATNAVARGETLNLTANATDALGRPIPTASLDVSWAFGEANLTVQDGQTEIPFTTPATADPQPVTLTWALEGPGLIPSQRTKQVRLLIDTNVTASTTVDALSGLVSVDIRLTDDQGAPLAGAPLNISWPLGEPITIRTDAEGTAQASLVIPDDAQPGDVPVQVRYEGDQARLPSETFETVPVRSAIRFQVADEVVWSQGNRLTITGRTVSADTNASVPLPLRVLHGGTVVHENTDPRTPFQVTLEPETVTEIAGDARQFTLELATNGSQRWAPTETTVIVQRLVPVDLVTGVNKTGDRVSLRLKATTPQGPLPKATITVGQEDAPPVKVQTDTDGEATVRLKGASGTLVARYAGDAQHAPANAQINLAEPAQPTVQDYGWLVFVAIAALLAVDIWIIYRVIQRIRVGRQVEEVLSELEDQLVLGDEVQAAIYHAYLRLKATAEVLGQPEEETETVREFGERFVGGLNLKAEPVMGLIGIFEQAWYGEVDPEMRTEAIHELRRLQNHLREEGLVA